MAGSNVLKRKDSNCLEEVVVIEPLRPAPLAAPEKKKKPRLDKATSSTFEEVLRASQPSPQSERSSWERPPLPRINPEADALIFQQIEADDYIDPRTNQAVVRFFGVTETGSTVVCHATGFLPYFYIPAPLGFLNEHKEQFHEKLEIAMRAEVRGGQNEPLVVRVQVVQKHPLYNYRGQDQSIFLKISLALPKHINTARRLFEEGFIFPGDLGHHRLLTFESNVAFLLRFMIDHKITGMCWLELPPKSYKFRPNMSNCQCEVEIPHDKIISHSPEEEWSKIAPIRILSFDIECAGRKGIFPEAKIDPIIQIASMVTVHGDSKPIIRNVCTLNSCAHIVGTQVLSFRTEEEMLQAWSDFLVAVDPDLIIGYNTNNFDFPYLLDRASHLRVARFPFLGRIKTSKTEAKASVFSSKAYGTRENKHITMDGRLQLDLLQVMQRDYKLRSYTLNSVCAHFLGEQKEEVHYSTITELQNGNDETRRRLAIYCLKDAYLPQRLLDKLMLFVNYTEMARVTGVPFNFVLTRGQQIRVISQLYRKALDEGFLVPALKSEGSDEQYEGATVIEPKKGYYDLPIAILDFASLYPSIMMAHNLCYTTLVDQATITKLELQKNIDYTVTPNNDCFVSPSVRKGLLPNILEDLLSARKRAKGDLKKENDPFKRAVLDGRQLALKVSANSVYGFTGATIGKLPCLSISSSVTAYGRAMIEKTKQEVEAQYTILNGYSHDAEVIYGDTDSVMVKFGTEALEETMTLGKEASQFVTQKFTKPINLEFEKVYFPYLLISKKRYAGLYWTRPDKYEKMDTKGIETVRRDNCRLVQSVIDACLRKILIDRDVQGAQEYAKQIISNLLQNKVDMSQLVITKALAKDSYAAKQAHVELAERMKKRDAGSAPTLGDRVAYVIIKAAKGDAAYKKSEDPIYVLENNLPIDTNYYLENQLSKPLMRIFEPILGDKAESLLKGEHTRAIQVAAPTVGGLAKFAVKQATCLSCRTKLQKDEPAVCKRCKPREAEIYRKQLETFNDLEVRFSRLWTQCQRCQGSLHQDVLCTSRDCPIFYMRKKAQKDMQDMSATMARFDYTW